MRRRIEKRFVFTQLSAVLIFCGALWVALLVVMRLWHLLGLTPDSAEHFRMVPGLVLLLIVLAGFVTGAWYAWRVLLVRLGLLSAEEAKGYPYSKPWKHE
jgi:hypothetical protein